MRRRSQTSRRSSGLLRRTTGAKASFLAGAFGGLAAGGFVRLWGCFGWLLIMFGLFEGSLGISLFLYSDGWVLLA